MKNETKAPRKLRKKRHSIWLEQSIIKQLDLEANEKRVSRQQVMESAIRERYNQNSIEDRDALIARRLNQIDTRQKVLERQLEIIAESFALFVRMWLGTNMEVPESQREATYSQAQKRYERFLASLSKRIATGQSILTELPKEVVLKEKDFGSNI